MIEEVPKPRGLRALLSMLFEGPRRQPTFSERQQSVLTQLGGASQNVAPQEKYQYLHTKKATNLLFWYCPDLTFSASDFARVGPPHAQFVVTRARNPDNLTPWMGYFLQFKTTAEAMQYYEETIGHELCGFPLKLKFTSPEIKGYKSNILNRVPNLTRKCHALVLGLPAGFSEVKVLRALWDYELLDNDKDAVEKLPIGEVKYGGNPILLRFKNEQEADRFVRDYDGVIFPHTDAKVLCQVVD